MSQHKWTVALSGFSGTSVAEPGGAVASALKKAFGKEIKIIALAYSSWTNAAFSSDLVDEIHIIAPLNSIDNHYSELMRVFQLCHPDIYIPNLELEVKYLHYFLSQFRQLGPKALIPHVTSFDRVSKLGLHYFCNENGFLYPKTIVANNPIEFNYIIKKTVFPCLIKSILNGAVLVNTLVDAYDAAARLSINWYQPILVQEYIAGDQYMVALLFDQNEEMIHALSAKKHLLDYFGKSAITLTVDEKKLNAIVQQVIKKVDWRGPLELEFIKTNYQDYYLFEINPRFPSWIDIASSIENNLPALLVQYLMKKKFKKVVKNNRRDVLLRDTDEVCLPIDRFYQLQKRGNLQLCNDTRHIKAQQKTTSHLSTIAITGVSAHHIPMPGLSLAKAFRHIHAPFQLACLAENYYDTGCYRTDLFDYAYQITFSENEKNVLSQISNVYKEMHAVAIVPTLDKHISLFVKIEKDLHRLGIKTLLPSVDSLNHVYQFPFGIYKKQFIAVPKSFPVLNEEELKSFANEVGYPFVFKKTGREKSCVKIIYTPSMLGLLHTFFLPQKNRNYFLQQYIEGEHFSICGLAAESGKLSDALAIKVVQSCMYGKTWMATQLNDKKAAPFLDCLNILVRELQWKGPIEIDCIRDRYNETLYCIDINPRFPSWIFYASVVHPGLLTQYIKLLTGNTIRLSSFLENEYLYIRLPKNFYSNINILGQLISGKGLNYHG